MEIIEAIKTRRSIRKFKDTEIPREVLDEIFEAARYAPSWANTQVWEFIVIKEQDTKDAISELLSPGNPARNAVKEAPVVLVVCGRKGISGFYKGSQSTILGDWLVFDAALISATLNLAAHAKGLGTVHVGFFDIPKVSSLLSVPDDVQVVEILPLGYPDQSPLAPKRREARDFVHFDKY
ncbi:MAG: nitroreductase family protein [Vulcanimicrobiota bacterium]